MPLFPEKPKFKRAYMVAETVDGTKYEFECEEPAFVSIEMQAPSFRLYDYPLDAIELPSGMQSFEMTMRANWTKNIHFTKTEGGS